MHRHNFLHGPSVPSGQRPSQWDPVAAKEGKNVAIPSFEILGAEIERGVGIVAQRIRASLEQDQIRGNGLKKPRQVLFQHLQQMGAVGLGGEGDGKVVGSVRVFLLRYIPKTDDIPIVISLDGKLADPGSVLDQLGGAVAVVKVEVEHGGGTEFAGAV